MDKREIHVTLEMLDQARRLGLTGSELVMAAIKKAIANDSAASVNEGIRFILPDGQVVETDESWPTPGGGDGEDA